MPSFAELTIARKRSSLSRRSASSPGRMAASAISTLDFLACLALAMLPLGREFNAPVERRYGTRCGKRRIFSKSGKNFRFSRRVEALGGGLVRHQRHQGVERRRRDARGAP